MRPRVKQIGSSEARQLVEPAWVRIGVHKDNRPAHPARTELCDELLDNRGIPGRLGPNPNLSSLTIPRSRLYR
jgi:hypothetical protein